MSSDREKRLADFELRLADCPSDLLDAGEHGRCVLIHPFGPASGKVARVAPGTGLSVDAYWQAFGDVYLLQTFSRAHKSSRPVGLYGRRTMRRRGYRINLVALIDAPWIDEATFRQCLRDLHRVMATGRRFGTTLERIA